MFNKTETAFDRLNQFGLRGVSATDLIAVILSMSSDDVEQNEPKARKFLKNLGLHRIRDLSPVDLLEISELENFQISRILAAIEVGRRIANSGRGPVEVISNSEDVAHIFNYLQDEKREHFCAIYLNSKNVILRVQTIHIGTVNMSVVGPREIFRVAIREGATSVIVAHNHPSGDPTPSHEDILITRRLADVGKLLDICLLDHVIIGQHRYISLHEAGAL